MRVSLAVLAVVLAWSSQPAFAGFVFVPPSPPEEPQAASAAGQPEQLVAPVAAPVQPAPPPVGEVTGDIVVVRTHSSVAAPQIARSGSVAINAADAQFDDALRAAGGSRLLVLADGSVSGATAARRVLGRCAALGRVCHVEYRGATPGTVQISKGN